ncbi:MAG: hypothetical protein NVSMB20_15990 [Bradyrhizobium sp.]
MSKAKPERSMIHLPTFDLRKTEIRLIGDSPLICHAWSQKAKQQMLDKQMKRAKAAKAAKDPQQDVIDSCYCHPEGGYGFPSIAFKSAAVDACSYVDGVTKVEARGAFHVNFDISKVSGDLTEIRSDLLKIEGEMTPREDLVKIALGTADIRHRGEFRHWAVNVPIRFNAGVLSYEQIVHLFNVAGFAVGVGEWRPQRDGSNGLFHVAGPGDL